MAFDDLFPSLTKHSRLVVTEPAYDVSRWDGLQHIDNPEEYPFYHVIPDRNDAIVAFGGERPWRYVCEENLEPCPKDNRGLDVDLELEWTNDVKNGKYVPPEELKLRHGEQLEDAEMTEKCLGEIKVRILSCFIVTYGVCDSSKKSPCSFIEPVPSHSMFNRMR